MSQYYNPAGVRDTYVKGKMLQLSRSKIDLFIDCPRCFYFEKKMSVKRPPGFPFALNSAVDALLKKEFDVHRANGTPHPLMETYGVDAIPFVHEDMDEWRENFKGVRFHHKDTNLLITGAVDDIWKTPDGKLVVVDYKSTAKEGEIGIDADWQDAYKRQMEVYQWLLRQNGFDVSNTGYFVYCNGKLDREAFDGKLEFDIYVIPYEGDDGWIEKTLADIVETLESEDMPTPGKECDYCAYRKAMRNAAVRKYGSK